MAARGRFRLFRRGFDFQSVCRQRVQFQVLHGVKAGARCQGSQQEFRRRHARFRAAVIGRLVAYHAIRKAV